MEQFPQPAVCSQKESIYQITTAHARLHISPTAAQTFQQQKLSNEKTSTMPRVFAAAARIRLGPGEAQRRVPRVGRALVVVVLRRDLRLGRLARPLCRVVGTARGAADLGADGVGDGLGVARGLRRVLD